MAYTREQTVALALKYKGATQGSARHKDLVDTFNRVKPHGEVGNYRCAWCAITVTAWLIKAGYTPKNMPMSYNCGTLISDAKRLGVWVEKDSFHPSLGDLVIYYWSDSGKGDCTSGASHVGMVCEIGKNTFTVIEGNKGSNSTVGLRTLEYNARYIRGFCHLNYQSGSKITYRPSTPYEGKLPKDTVHYGSQGDDVKAMQTFLNWCDNAKLAVDGSCGQASTAAIYDFQVTYNLEVDGYFGPACRKEAQSIIDLYKKVQPKPEPKTYSGEFPSIKKSKRELIANKADELAYKDTASSKAKYPSGKPTEAFKKALDKVYPDRKKWGKAPRLGASCDVFVGTVVRSSGVDSKFPRGLGDQKPYLAKSDKFDMVSTDPEDAKTGDIITYVHATKSGGHICIKYGSKLKHAAYESWYGRTTSPGNRFSKKVNKDFKVWRATGTYEGSLHKGDTGTEVKRLQKFLNWYGSYKLDVDGSFGDKTEDAVKKFQKATGLTADGYFGPASLAKAKEIKK